MLKESLQAQRKQGEVGTHILPRTEAWGRVGNGTAVSPPHSPMSLRDKCLKRHTFTPSVAMVTLYL